MLSYVIDTCGIFYWLGKEKNEKFKVMLLADYAMLCSINSHIFIKHQKNSALVIQGVMHF